MDLEQLNKLDILSISAYSTEKRDEEGSALETFEAIFEVESFTRKYEHVYQGAATAGINTSARAAKYSYSRPSYLSFQLFIDGTGLAQSGMDVLAEPELAAEEQISRFLDVCHHYDGEIHQPRFLVIKWGSMAFNCRLASVEITYTLFDTNGDPLRAELNAVFLEDINDELRAKLEDKRSPDIARSRTVLAGDSLPSLCRKIYGSEAWFLALARYNGIDHPREIRPGMEIQFPPLEELDREV